MAGKPESEEAGGGQAETAWREILAGITLMLTGLVLLECMGAVAKLLGQRYPIPQISLARNLFGLIPMVAILLWEVGGRFSLASLRLRRWRLGVARGVMVVFAQLALYGAYQHLELASVSVIAYAGPMFVTLLAIFWLGERVGPWRWGAVIGGFVGIVMVIGPGTDLFTWYGLLPVVAAFLYANTLVLTRLFDVQESHVAINLYGLAGSIVCSAGLLFATAAFDWPEATGLQRMADFGLALLLGLFGGTGVYLLTLAFRRVAASILAPFEYFGLIASFAIGWIVFREWPVERVFPGILLIVGAGLVIVYREHRAGRK